MSSVLKNTVYLSLLQAGRQLRASQCWQEIQNSEVICDREVITIQSKFGSSYKKIMKTVDKTKENNLDYPLLFKKNNKMLQSPSYKI